MADFSFPKVSVDPGKIKDRWGLGALGLVVWLMIAYGLFMRPGFNVAMGISVLTLTFVLLLFVLMLSFTRTQESIAPQAQSPNVQPAGLEGRGLGPQKVAYLAELYEFYKNPEVQNLLDEKFGKKKR